MENKKVGDKYYLTKIEDIRIGYEMYCPVMGTDQMVKIICSNIYDLHAVSNRMGNNYSFPDIYRTKYLDRTDIESLGWKHRAVLILATTRANEVDDISRSFELDEYVLVFHENTSKIIITLGLSENILFKGICPSINELRYILNLLKINLVSLKQ